MKIFISYAPEDESRIQAIVQPLRGWHAPYWIPPRVGNEAEISTQIQHELGLATAFLRVCSPATPRSYWMTFERTAFVSLQAEEFRQTQATARKLIHLIVDSSYRREPFDYADTMIDATNLGSDGWRRDLQAALFGNR